MDAPGDDRLCVFLDNCHAVDEDWLAIRRRRTIPLCLFAESAMPTLTFDRGPVDTETDLAVSQMYWFNYEIGERYELSRGV